MEITIKCTVEELEKLLDYMHIKEVPCILDELHEDFEEAPDNPDPSPEPQPYPATGNIDPDPNPAKCEKGKGKRKHCPVDVMDGKRWRRFPSVKDAALFIGCSSSQVSTSIANGYKCKGHEVRYSREEPDEEVLP